MSRLYLIMIGSSILIMLFEVRTIRKILEEGESE